MALNFRSPQDRAPEHAAGRPRRSLWPLVRLATLVIVLLVAVNLAFRGDESSRDGTDAERTITAQDIAGTRPRATLPGVDPQLLKTIRDDTPGGRAAEYDAWFHLLGLVDTIDARTLRDASSGPVTYLQLDQQPEAYRGEVVTLRGTARDVQTLEAPENPHGIDAYHQLVLQPSDRPTEPVLLYVLELPAGFPRAGALSAPIEATSVFYKRQAYESLEGIRTAPALMGKTIQWTPPRERPSSPAQPPPLWLVLAAALLLTVAVVGLIYWRTRRDDSDATHESREVVLPPHDPPD